MSTLRLNRWLNFLSVPGKGIQSLDEAVSLTVIFLSALQQGSSSMHDVTSQETVLEAKVSTKGLDTDVLQTDEEEKLKLKN